MKKTLISILAVAALAACNKADIVETNPGEAIAFGNAFVDNATKAAEDPSYGTNNPITEFFVYGAVEGVNIFAGETVTKGQADYGDAWGCTGNTQYWIAGANYIFDAVVGVEKTKITTDDATGLPTQIAYAMTDQNDMLYKRVATVGKPATGLVEFTFSHLLSKVKMSITNNTPATATTYSYKITDISLTNVYTSANYTTTGSWVNPETGTYPIADIAIASGSEAECETEILLVPGASIGVSFKVNVLVGNKIITTTPVTKTAVLTPEANKAYSLNVTVGLDDEIKFTVKENPSWDTPTNDVTVQ